MDLFLDSGAFTLYSRSIKYMRENNSGRWDYYHTDEFWKYVDDYAAFVKANKCRIAHYANLDVIHNPSLSWKVQKYLEDHHGLYPVPVIHHGVSTKWIKRYIDEGYPMIGLGGLSLDGSKTNYIHWINEVYTLLCSSPKNLPIVKTHGFAITSFKIITGYPWYSVDSVTWVKRGMYGELLIPKKKNGKFDFKHAPITIAISIENPNSNKTGSRHYSALSKAEKRHVVEWLDQIKIPLGKFINGKTIEDGVFVNPYIRWHANLLYFEELRKSLPEWPWPWRTGRRQGFGL